MWRNWNPCALLGGAQHGAAAVEDGLAPPRKLNIESPYEPAVYFWVHTRENWKQGFRYFSTNGQKVKTPPVSSNRRMDEPCCNSNTEDHPDAKANATLGQATAWWTPEAQMLSEIRQTQRYKRVHKILRIGKWREAEWRRVGTEELLF